MSSLTEFDVLCGRDKQSFGHPGNQRFRELVQQRRESYQQARRRIDKNAITKALIWNIQEKGKFLKLDGGHWTPLDDEGIYEKVSHALRGAKCPEKRAAKKVHKQKLTTPPPAITAINCSFDEIKARQKSIFQTLLQLQGIVGVFTNLVSDESSCSGWDDATIGSNDSHVQPSVPIPCDVDDDDILVEEGLELDSESDFELFASADFLAEV